MHFRKVGLALIALFISTVALAQQTGAISGKVTASDGTALPGVTIEARSTVLPQARVTETSMNGDYRLPQLPPGRYTVTYSLAGMSSKSRQAEVFLNQDTTANVELGLETISESIVVTAETPLIDTTTTEVKSALGAGDIADLPVGQEYRDLIKLLPGVQYTEMNVRGPSAGGSGQDNMYQFDGVNVTLPLFGTLSAEPSTHDIQQISVVKGGAKAIDFNRAAGFTVDSVSKSGTSEFKGMVSYLIQNASMIGDLDRVVVSQGDVARSWATVNLGGPLLRDRLFFFASYYRPEVETTDRSNAYGPIPDSKIERDEIFGKLTYSPTSTILLNASYRDSSREGLSQTIGAFSMPTVATTEESKQKIGILEASWVPTSTTYATFKFTDYANETLGGPNTLFADVHPSIDVGSRIDINNLERMGQFNIPTPVTGATAFNAFIAPFIDKYGFVNSAGVKAGGGIAGGFNNFNDQDFFRKNWQVGFNYTLGTRMTHDLHVGVQSYTDEEDLKRVSNGWGTITIPGGRGTVPNTLTVNPQSARSQPAFFQARFLRTTGSLDESLIHSELVSQSFEINDTIRWGNWAFNAGAVVSNDTLYGQGLKDDPSTLSGYVLSPGSKYTMYEVPWSKQIQPRVGTTWAYNGRDNVYVSYAKYNPPTTSLPRAAAWDRGQFNLFYDVYFDATGTAIASNPVGSSSGKLFQDDLDPRYVDEYLIGTSRQFNNAWTGRFYARHRYSSNFWEDTNNDARVLWAPEGYPKTLYIPDLDAKRVQLCDSNKPACTASNRAATRSGSTYVIAELDGAFTKYYEATAESEWRTGRTTVRGSYTWSQYYGTFDQDNTNPGNINDNNIFMGSSFLADGAGLQVWDNKYGFLKGDKRHVLKGTVAYHLNWNANVGLYGVYQSGEAWETWDYEPYRTLPGFSGLNDINRYAEPAGSRRGPSHYQFDANYTQDIPIRGFNLEFDLDVFNLLDKQTGYAMQPGIHSAAYGTPTSFYRPRRYQVAVRFEF